MVLKNTMVLRWVDKKDVIVLTTIHKPQVKTQTNVKKKPLAVIDYKRYMGGFDHSDQMVADNTSMKACFPPRDTHLGAGLLSVPKGKETYW